VGRGPGSAAEAGDRPVGRHLGTRSARYRPRC
jgi:hypothetical protein